MLSNGEDIIAELPIEHLVMYEGYGRIGKLLSLGTKCLCCHKVAKHFLMIREGRQQRFALYTDDYIELTIDHKVPKSKGGKNRISNYQVLCLFCNRTKGSADMSIEDLRNRVRSIARNIL